MNLDHSAGRQRADGASRRRSSIRPARSAALLPPRPFRARPARGPRRLLAVRPRRSCRRAYEHLRGPAAGRLSGPSARRPRDRPRRAPPRHYRPRGRQRQYAVPARFDPRGDRRPGLRAGARRASDPCRRSAIDPASLRRLLRRGHRRDRYAGASAKASFISISTASTTPQARERLAEALRASMPTLPSRWRTGGTCAPASASDRGTTGRIRRRFRPTRSPRRSPSWNGSNARQLHFPRLARIPLSGGRHGRRSGQGTGLGLLRDPSVRVLRRGKDLVVMSPEVRAFLERAARRSSSPRPTSSRACIGAPISTMSASSFFDARMAGSKASCASSGSSRRAPIPA